MTWLAALYWDLQRTVSGASHVAAFSSTIFVWCADVGWMVARIGGRSVQYISLAPSAFRTEDGEKSDD